MTCAIRATIAASHGIPLFWLQEWAGWADPNTARIYAKYAPKTEHAAQLGAAFAGPSVGTVLGTELRDTGTNSDQLNPDEMGVAA